MANNTNGKPVAEIRVGRITATIWQNTPTDEGVFYSVHITRLFAAAGPLPAAAFSVHGNGHLKRTPHRLVSPKNFFHCLGLELITVFFHCSCPPASVLHKFKFLKN